MDVADLSYLELKMVFEKWSGLTNPSLDIDSGLSSYMVDIDGCLACTSGMNMIDFDLWCWDKFKNVMYNAPVNNTLKYIVNSLYLNSNVCIVTARPWFMKDITFEWLVKNNIQFDHLFMMGEDHFNKTEAIRDHGELRTQHALYKKDVLEFINEHSTVVGGFDDTQSIIDMYRDHNVLAFHVEFDSSKFG